MLAGINNQFSNNLPKLSKKFQQSLKHQSSSLTPLSILFSTFKMYSFDSILSVFVCFINSIISFSIPFCNNYIINLINPQTDTSLNHIIFILLLIFTIKITKISSFLLSDWVIMMTGNKYYGYFMSNLMTHYQKLCYLSGRSINHIEEDSQRITFLPYSVINLIFISLEIILSGYVITYLIRSNTSYLIFLSILIFVVGCIFMGYAYYKINQEMLRTKDRRIDSNLQGDGILQCRLQQIGKVNKFLKFNMLIKMLGIICSGVLFFVVFWIEDTQDNKYVVVMILGLLRSRIERFMIVLCLMMQVYNSMRRVSKTMQPQILQNPQQQSSSLAINKQQSMQTLSIISQASIPFEKGEIQVSKLWFFIKPSINRYQITLLLLSIVFTLAINITLLEISKNVLTNSQLIYFLPIILQIFCVILVFFSIKAITISISKYISNNMVNLSNSYQTLNRLSGDIRAVDRSLCMNAFDLTMSLLSILASISYTLLSIKVYQLVICFSMITLLIVVSCIKINRYFMKSRRQIMREQCKTKSVLISHFYQNNQQFLKALQKVYCYKWLGLKCQVICLAIILSLSVLSTLIAIILAIQLNFDHSTTIVLVFAFMQLDSDIENIFMGGIRFEMALVSVQRCINVVNGVNRQI